MKLIMILAAAAFATATAHADPVTVMTPKPGANAAETAAYLTKLDLAVKRVCLRAASPVIGLNYYVYHACLKETRADVGRKDPTGLYAQRDSGGEALAAR